MNNETSEARASLENLMIRNDFSGSIYVKQEDDVLFEAAGGYADRSEERLNTVYTRFGIASGCKLFTAVAIAQLVEQGKIFFESKLKDCLEATFPYFDEQITIHHLLTHTSGVPDYFDEDVMDDFEELWKTKPMYSLRELRDFLPLFQGSRMKFQPGDDFHYNNAGYILLGLVVEAQTGMRFQDYVETYIFKPTGMNESGYFSLDQLPKNSAYGYIELENGTWRTNHYSIPVVGGSDGGAFVTAPDMVRFWEALRDGKVLQKETVGQMFTSHIKVRDRVAYGYGVWIQELENNETKYHIMGYDPGVSFHSAYYPSSDLIFAVPSNKSDDAFDMMKAIEKEWI